MAAFKISFEIKMLNFLLMKYGLVLHHFTYNDLT